MRKLIPIFAILLLMVGFYGCSRDQAPTADNPFGPSTSHVVINLSAHPSVVQALDNFRNTSSNISVVKAKIYDFQKGPLSNVTIFFYISDVSIPFTSPNSDWSCAYIGSWGNINGDQTKSVNAVTDLSGVASITYTPPPASGMKVVCDTGEVDPDTGEPVYVYYNVDYITVYITATWKGQEWPDGSFGDVSAIVPIKVLR